MSSVSSAPAPIERSTPLRGAAAALVPLLLSAACGPSRARMLEGEIAQAVQTSPGHIDLVALFPARWDRVCVLTPGASRAQVDRVLGFRYPAGPYLVSRTDVAGLVFVRGDEVVVAMRYPREDGDFTALGPSYCLPRADAVFHSQPAPGAGDGRLLLPVNPPAAGTRP